MTDRVLTLDDDIGRTHAVSPRADGTLGIDGAAVAVADAADGSVVVVAGGRQHIVWTAVSAGSCWVFIDGDVFVFDVNRPAGRRRPPAADHGPIEAPMPATVRRIAVAPGDEVRRGDILVVLEAMKMELPIRAAGDGRVDAVSCREGELVQPGRELVRIR